MYQEHWDLPMKPFESAPDARFYFRTGGHEGALAKLRYAVENRLGAGLIWGPPGSGKTLVLEILRAQLDPERFFAVPVPVTGESPEGLLYSLLAGLGETELSGKQGEVITAALMRRVEEWLEAVAQSKRHTVALIDEAHLLRDRKSLENVRLLLNPPQGSERGITVVLAGQEELASRVARFTPLDERIEVHAPLGSMAEDEAMAYLLHRVEAAGGRRGIFTRVGARELARAGHYLPGPMNRLAELCLVAAFAAGLDRVGPDVVAAVLEDMRAGRGDGEPSSEGVGAGPAGTAPGEGGR
jgi:type II secretory pathway predicted ATPase ExeA